MLKKVQLSCVLIVFFCLTKGSLALDVDTLVLSNVSIVSRVSGQQKENLIDSQTAINQNLNHILSNSGHVFVRNNAPGVLALASVGGLYGHQTALLWNGLNIQSPMNGLFDLNLIPAFFLDNVSLNPHAYTTHSGSGSLGGSIELTSGKLSFNEKSISLIQNKASFQNSFTGMDVQYGSGKYYSRTRLFYQTAQNDFPLVNPEWQTNNTRQVNNALVNKGLLQEFGFITGKKSLLEFKAWLQQSDRELPATFMTPSPKQNQEDEIHRIVAGYKTSVKKLNLNFLSAYFRELIVYEDPGSFLARNLSESFLLEMKGEYKLNQNQNLEFGLNQTENFARVDDYGQQIRQSLTFASAHLHSEVKNVQTTMSIRGQLWDGQLVPPSVSIHAKYPITGMLNAYGSLGYSYRIPTLNDLYWIPGGNPELLPESGFKQRLGLKYSNKQNKIGLSAFSNRVRNMIIWLDNGLYWEPDNFRSVWARGIEADLNIRLLKKESLIISVESVCNFILSTYREVEDGNEDIVGNQLILIPQEMLTGKLKIQYKKVWTAFQGQAVGVRYTGTDNLSWIDPFYLFDFEAGYRFKLSDKAQGVLSGGAYNLLNHAYMNMPGRPMPGRNYSITMKINFNLNNKQE
jgi:vitamin B12 transporter